MRTPLDAHCPEPIGGERCCRCQLRRQRPSKFGGLAQPLKGILFFCYTRLRVNEPGLFEWAVLLLVLLLRDWDLTWMPLNTSRKKDAMFLPVLVICHGSMWTVRGGQECAALCRGVCTDTLGQFIYAQALVTSLRVSDW
jgi:hypothetical protein